LKNSDAYKQVFSGYEQWNVVQKLRYKPTEHIDLQYSFYYGGTGTAPRYDRLIEYRNGKLRFAEWNYGPMLWRMHTVSAGFTKPTALYDEAKLIVGYQNYEESRIDRQRNNPNRRTQAEQVEVWSANLDANKALKKGELFYGAEALSNLVGSTANSTNINTGVAVPVATRYPDGSTWKSIGAYASYKLNFHPKFTLSSGLRYNYSEVHSTFSKEFFPYPFDEANLKDGAFTGNLGLVYRPAAGWQLNAIAATGFRVPNIDDMGKLFESAPRQVTVPNPDLQSEYAWNFEVGVVRQKQGKYRMEINGFHTILDNAIVRRPYSINGQDSIFFDGAMSQVFALQNVGKATVWGMQALFEVWMQKGLSAFVMANYITGKETDDVKNEQVPLRHAPPFYGSAGIRFERNKFRAEINGQCNAEVSADQLAPSEQAKVFIYATDENGQPYSPAWYTVNAKASYRFGDMLVSAGLENITNQRYRPYSSGIVAPGINFILSARYAF
jgi:hemoglobin/transferrin/lactoferrin receptor protein